MSETLVPPIAAPTGVLPVAAPGMTAVSGASPVVAPPVTPKVPVVGEDVDLTDEAPPSTTPPPLPTAYAPDKDRESVRGLLALTLVGLLGLVVLGSLIGLRFGVSINDIKEFLSLALGPLVALVGSATGFYFGSGGARNGS